MKNKIVILFLCFFSALNAYARQIDTSRLPISQHRLMPVPAAFQFQQGRQRIDSSFSVALEGYTDERLQGAIFRMSRRLEGRTGYEFSRTLTPDAKTAALLIQCKAAGKAIPALDEDESYNLEATPKQTVLQAATVVGVLRGLETFLQLLDSDSDGYFIQAVSIQDKPRFPWRGLLIDAGRHFEPVEVIKRNLDGMAAVKLNVLHWHLTEDQGFRVESKRFPRLHKMGSDGLFYTQEQVREVIDYARERGIRVMPEFDLPGHATAWLVGHPELGSAPGPYQIERKNGIFEPALDPTREEVYKFLESFFTEMASLFPDAFMHIGGDENEGHQWSKNPQIQSFMKANGIKDNHTLQAYFNQRMSKIFQKLGKRMIGWDEILHTDLPKDTVIHSWRGPASLAQGAQRGYYGILSAGYYIDLMYPTWQHYKVDPVAADSKLDQEALAHILGGEATMWGEWVNQDTIDSRIWPRTAAIAERLWSPRDITDVEDMYRRLEVISLQLEELGLTHEKNGDMLLRRLAKSFEIAPLKTLVSVVEPVKEYTRSREHPMTMLGPFTRLIDAARADSRAGREFAAQVEGLLADSPGFSRNQESLKATMAKWRDVSPDLDLMIARSPVLFEAKPLSRDLAEIGKVGLEALAYFTTETVPPAGWREERLTILERAAKPKAEVEFVIINPIRKLILVAAQMAELKTLPRTEWKSRMQSLTPEETRKGG